MKKIFLSLSIVTLFVIMGNSQHRYLYNHYIVNPVLINPGASGFDYKHNLFLDYRNTWANQPGSPKTFTFSYDGNVAENIGLGAQIMSDRYSELETFKGQLSYSYILQGEQYRFGLGFTTEYTDYHVVGGLTGGIIDRNDPYLAIRQDGDRFFDLAFGAHGVIQDKFLLSVTLPQLLHTKLNSREGEVEQDKIFNYVLGLGYIFESQEYALKVVPSLYVKKLGYFNTLIDANLLFSFSDDKFTSGLSYELGDEGTFGFLIGTKFGNFNLYYSYDFAFKEFQTYNNGSHELTLGYRIGK